LTPNAEGCELSYTVHSTVGGKLAQLGQRLIDGAAKSLAEDFFRRFDEALQAQYPRAAATPEAATDSGTSAAQNALSPWVWAAGAIVLGMAAWWLTR
jgi:hypothetical protein